MEPRWREREKEGENNEERRSMRHREERRSPGCEKLVVSRGS